MTQPAVLSRRDSSLDVARGVAMILVVMGHSIRGLAAAKIGPRLVVGQVDTFLYLIRLPVFALAVGLLTVGAVERRGWRSYLTGRASLLLYLYLVWTVLQGAAEVLTTPWKNHPVGWLDVLMFWRPLGHLWFLPHLAVVSVVLVAVAPWRRTVRALVGSGIVLVVSLAGWGWDPGLIGLGGLGLLGWYVLGAAIGAERLRDAMARIPTPALVVTGLPLLLVVAGMVVWLPVTAPTIDSPTRDAVSIGLGVVAVGLGVTGTFALTTAWTRSRTSAWVAYVGRQSLAVYLPHIIATAGTRVVLLRLGVTDLLLHVLAGTFFGVVGPLLLERLTRGAPYLFVPPWKVRQRRRVAALT